MALVCAPHLRGRQCTAVEGRGSIIRRIALVVISISSVPSTPGHSPSLKPVFWNQRGEEEELNAVCGGWTKAGPCLGLSVPHRVQRSPQRVRCCQRLFPEVSLLPGSKRNPVGGGQITKGTGPAGTQPVRSESPLRLALQVTCG